MGTHTQQYARSEGPPALSAFLVEASETEITSVKASICEIKGGGHRVPPAGLPIEQVLGEYSLSFLRRDVALFVSTRARNSF